MTYKSLGTERTDDGDDDDDGDDNVGGGGGGNDWGVDDDDDVDNLQWGTKVLRHFRKMTPFCMVDIPIPFPPKSMLNFGPSSLFFFTQTTLIRWGGGGGGVGGGVFGV